mmetsp:Transcript_40982/g.108305  ORF Transcript_40982/g.108305 Transcript_40982/m.108305 type:complete len:239 (-) Transcript_40982:304-1020(-)
MQKFVAPIVSHHPLRQHGLAVAPDGTQRNSSAAGGAAAAGQWDDGLTHNIIRGGLCRIEARHGLALQQAFVEIQQRSKRETSPRQLLDFLLPTRAEEWVARAPLAEDLAGRPGRWLGRPDDEWEHTAHDRDAKRVRNVVECPHDPQQDLTLGAAEDCRNQGAEAQPQLLAEDHQKHCDELSTQATSCPLCVCPRCTAHARGLSLQQLHWGHEGATSNDTDDEWEDQVDEIEVLRHETP